MVQVDNLLAELMVVKTSVEQLRRRHNSIAVEAKEIYNSIANKGDILSNCEKSQEYYKRAVDILYSRSIGELESLLNSALAYVFYDKPYKIRLDLDFSRGKKSVSIVLLDNTDEDEPVEIDVKDGVGNGIRTVISFILSVYYILSKKVFPILLLDESYSYLSAQYVQRFFELMKGFCEKKGLRVVLISHDVRFLDYSNKKYVVADGMVSEVK